MIGYHVTANFVVITEVGDSSDNIADEVRGLLEDDQVRDLKVHVQQMPGFYNRQLTRSEEAKREIENDTDQGVSFIDKVSGPPRVRHPWDDGMNIFPPDHPLYDVEQHYKQHNDRKAAETFLLINEQLKELPSGEGS